jgi:SAM-dependent methyltransferase
MMEDVQCCVTKCERPLDKTYWDNQYIANTTGWDLGQVSPPIQTYIDTIENKNAAILIPGCGNTYEAEYLLQEGFTNVTVIDIAPTLVATLQKKFANNKNIKIVQGDFFEHTGSYDYIIEQTFFCALPPAMRLQYVQKMHQLLNTNGLLVGLLFNRTFDSGPPFGGSKTEYEMLFKYAFALLQIGNTENSIKARANTELFIEFQKNENAIVTMFGFEGISCNGCMADIIKTYNKIPDIQNAIINTAFNEVLIVSNKIIPIEILQEAIAYDAKYKIIKK